MGVVSLKLYQILLVLTKNYVLQFRRPIITLTELALPIIAILVLIAIRHLVPEFQSQKQCFVTFEADPLLVPYTGNYTLYFTPNNSNTSRIADIIEYNLPGSKLLPAESEDELVERIANEYEEKRLRGCFFNGAGIVFNSYNGTDLSYTLRLRHETPTRETGQNKWYTRLRIPRIPPTGPRVYDTSYLNEGFLHLEHVVGQALIEFKTGLWPELPPVKFKQFPHTFFEDDLFLASVDFILPCFIMISFIVSVGLFTKELVLEKETRIRETLKMNGLTNGILWFTWFIKQFFFLIIPVVLVGVLLVVGEIFPHSNIGAVVVVMVVYLLSLLCFSFFISVWFDNSQLGMMAGFTFSFLTLIPHFFIAAFYEEIQFPYKIVACLLPNTCIGLAVNVIAELELRREGLQFIDFTRNLSSDDPFSIYIVISVLLLDCVLFMIIGWYINEWRPGQYGIPRKFYFPFQLSYWTGRQSKSQQQRNIVAPISTATENDDNDQNGSTHEKLVPEPEIGIELKGLRKKFKAWEYSKVEIHAVNNLYLKVYKGQITALLGHNGAGKTTTMSILTGLFPPTSGSAHINGLSVVDDIDLIRRNLGICPQYNVLFDRLTVAEHLNFFARLKGIPRDKIGESIDTILKQLKMQKFKNYKAKNLSGGNKRKLSVAIAMTGDPDIVILDEPTSGMDHMSRILTWELLEKRRNENKTILITTHSLDDTEKSDRIAIMVEGKLACSGQPAWLKEKYDVGYKLKVTMSSHAVSQKIEDTIKKHISHTKPYVIGSDVQALLPLESLKRFSSLFRELEVCQKELNITSFSIQENKMEDVFIKAGEGQNKSCIQPHHNPMPSGPSLYSDDYNTWAFEGTTPSPTSSINDSIVFNFQRSQDIQPAGYPVLDQSSVFTSPFHRSNASAANVSFQPSYSSKVLNKDLRKGADRTMPILEEISLENIENTPIPQHIDRRLADLMEVSSIPGSKNPSNGRSCNSSVCNLNGSGIPLIIEPDNNDNIDVKKSNRKNEHKDTMNLSGGFTLKIFYRLEVCSNSNVSKCNIE